MPKGRRSAAELTLPKIGRLETYRRPDAPAELTDEQAIEWRVIVERLPADWFPAETWPLLVAYCRHIVQARRIAFLIDAAEKAMPFDRPAYCELVRSGESLSKSIAMLATKMRIAQQSTYDQGKKAPIVPSKPWDRAA